MITVILWLTTLFQFLPLGLAMSARWQAGPLSRRASSFSRIRRLSLGVGERTIRRARADPTRKLAAAGYALVANSGMAGGRPRDPESGCVVRGFWRLMLVASVYDWPGHQPGAGGCFRQAYYQ
jgi:hypothetical protein